MCPGRGVCWVGGGPERGRPAATAVCCPICRSAARAGYTVWARRNYFAARGGPVRATYACMGLDRTTAAQRPVWHWWCFTRAVAVSCPDGSPEHALRRPNTGLIRRALEAPLPWEWPACVCGRRRSRVAAGALRHRWLAPAHRARMRRSGAA